MTRPQNVLQELHRTCAELLPQLSDYVTLDEAAAAAFAAELAGDAVEVAASIRGLQLPVRFASLEQELTLLALLHLLDFGSGYEPALLAQQQASSRGGGGGRGVRETLLYGLLGLHLGGATLDRHKLASLSMYDMYQVFGIEAVVETEVMPGVTMSKPGPLAPLCRALLGAFHDAAAALAAAGQRSLGSLLLSIGDDLAAAGRTSAAAFVEELVDALPPFRDAPLVVAAAAPEGAGGGGGGRAVPLHRRAQGLVADLGEVYGRREARFAFRDGADLAADSGATTIGVLLAKGVLVAAPSLAEAIAAGAEVAAGPGERALRCAAVAAADRLVTLAAAAAAAAEGRDGDAAEASAAAGEGGGAAGAGGEAGAGAGRGSGEAAPASAGAAVAAAAAAAAAGTSGAPPPTPPFTAAQLGAYMSYLTEEGRPLHGRVKRHVTAGVTAY